MARIGILTCTNAVQELGCSSAVCLADLRKREEFRARVKKLFGQERKTMVDVIMGRD